MDELRQNLHNRLQEVLYHLFPAGKVVRNTFMVGNVQGHEGDSLTVEISGNKVGLWYDFATGEGGDIFSLWGAVHGWDHRFQFPEIVSSIQEWLGTPPRPLPESSMRTERETEGWGTPTGKWDYQDINGHLIARIYRYDTPKGKQFRPWDAKTQKHKAPDPRPLYNQPGIAHSGSVIVVEGEKCANALINLGICATTAMNGANAPVDKTDWSPLCGKHVMVWPDQDAPGKGYADKVIKKLRTLDLSSLALLVIPEDKPEKWDAADAVAELVSSLVFSRWLENPQGEFPLAVISDGDAAAIGAKTTIAHLSKETVAKQNAHHPELTPDEYTYAQQCVDQGERIQDGPLSLIYLLESEGYVTVIKATKTGESLFVTSFRRLSKDAAKQDSEIRRLRRKGL